RVCNSAILMNGGQQMYGGDTVKGIEAYFSLFPHESGSKSGDGGEILDFQINAGEKEVQYGSDMCISCKLRTVEDNDNLILNLVFFDMEMKGVASCSSAFFKSTSNEMLDVAIDLRAMTFAPGSYSVSAMLMENTSEGKLNKQLVHYRALSEFVVVGREFVTHTSFQLVGEWKVNDNLLLDKHVSKN
ncbi:MAG: hypothetical protein O3B83_03285, partial [Bacteroidetes bacterium]|nr:hypothetical protein [Bacteroidota bacterium]